VGLIAREIEARGIPTLSMTSALSITRSVNPPRAAFVDYPLGHTSGKPHAPELQRNLLLDSLRAFETLEEPGGLVRRCTGRKLQASEDLARDGRVQGRGDEAQRGSSALPVNSGTLSFPFQRPWPAAFDRGGSLSFELLSQSREELLDV
jgi:hypothetical protein